MKMSFIFFFTFLINISVFTQIPYNQSPGWISTDVTSVSTGGMFTDINKDGWLDYVVANGNDMARQKVVVYYNNGNGTFPTTPNWQSADIDYHGHLDVGDVNSDGYPDVAVSVYIGATGFSSPGKVKLYLNNSGTLSSNPSWTSADNVYTFSCAFGDANGDGLLDLAVACGESYNNYTEQQRIYFNTGGALETLPSWKSTAFINSYDVNWFDMDNDKDLDIVFGNEGYPNYVFQNNNGVISNTPTWQSTDASMQANSLFTGDVNSDGYFDLAISDNNQLGGTGRFKIYLNNNGMLNSTPFWTSAFSGYGSGILLADIDVDNDLDLITGGWWNPVRIYLNNIGNFNSTPEYTSSTSSVVEAIFCGDVNNFGLQSFNRSFFGDGITKLFYASQMHLQYINQVLVNDDTLQLNEYCYDLENGWISFANAPASGSLVSVEVGASWSLDLGVTNWDNNIGNYLFSNTIIPVELISFNANVANSTVMLNWVTASEINNSGFQIERRKTQDERSSEWETIGFVNGKGTTTEISNYSFVDDELLAQKTFYRLKQIDFNGSFEYSNVIAVEINLLKKFSLEQNYPNPFNPSTKISWQLPVSSNVTLKVYDVLGREVVTLVDEYRNTGSYNVEFTIENLELSSGIYFYQLKAGEFVETKKMILLR
jgi:hypothetical protein